MQLLHLGQQRDNFLSQVSHELRTPMASIRSFAEILQEAQTDNPKDGTQNNAEQTSHFASIIHDESMRLTRLLDNILEISFLESGQARLDVQFVALTQLSRAELALNSLISEYDAIIELNLHAEDQLVETDADRLLQVLINLMSNAIKHNDKTVPHILISAKL